MTRPVALGATVLNDGRTLRIDVSRRSQATLQALAGQRVTVRIGPEELPITQDQRGYFFGVLIEAMVDLCGYARKEEAYDAAMRWLLTLPWEELRPSLAAGACDRAQMSEYIERMCAAQVVDLGLDVPDPTGSEWR